ncbi:MAG: DNA-binding protein [Magnetospirillum sp.]|nr:DNA-binding protein [Magnetospirillum sp.]
MQPDNPEILSEARAAEFLGKQPRTLANWRALRKGPPFVKIGRTAAYRRAAVLTWIEGQERSCAPAEPTTAARPTRRSQRRARGK